MAISSCRILTAEANLVERPAETFNSSWHNLFLHQENSKNTSPKTVFSASKLKSTSGVIAFCSRACVGNDHVPCAAAASLAGSMQHCTTGYWWRAPWPSNGTTSCQLLPSLTNKGKNRNLPNAWIFTIISICMSTSCFTFFET